MKKRIVLLSIFLALDIILLAVSGWMFFQASRAQSGFHPIVTNANENANVGQMRVPRMAGESEQFGTCESPAEIEVREHVPAGKTYNGRDLEEGHSLLVVRIKDPTGGSNGDFNYTIYRYCEEDGFWYQVYLTSFAFRGYASAGEEWEKYFEIPSDVLEEPGKYIIEIKNMNGRIGGCTFELPLK